MVFPRLEVLYGDQVLHSLALPPAPRRAGQPPAAAAAAVAVWRNRMEEDEAEPDDEIRDSYATATGSIVVASSGILAP